MWSKNPLFVVIIVCKLNPPHMACFSLVAGPSTSLTTMSLLAKNTPSRSEMTKVQQQVKVNGASMTALRREMQEVRVKQLEQQKQLQQQAAQTQAQLEHSGGGTAAAGEERMGSPTAEAEHAQMAALAAMRAVAAGLQRAADSPMSERSSVGDEEDEDDDGYGEYSQPGKEC